MLKRVKGRPEDVTGRLDKEIRCYDFLDRLNIEYERIDHEAVMTIDACADVDVALEAQICKNLFLSNRQDTHFYLLMIPGEKKFQSGKVSKALGVSRLQFADASYMEEFLDITPGSVSVLGLMNDHDKHVKLLIDQDIVKEQYFGCHPCINTSSLRIRMKDLLEKIIPGMDHEPIFLEIE